MGVVVSGSSSGNGWEVDSGNIAKVNPRPPAFGSLGYYRLTAQTSAITTGTAANTNLFCARWTDATRFALIQSIRVSCIASAAIGTSVPFDLAVFFVRSWTVSPSGGSSVSISSNNQKLRTSMGSSLFGAIQISTSGAVTIGSSTVDSSPIGVVSGTTGTTAGTQTFTVANPQPLFLRANEDQHPIVLAQNEGVTIQNPLVFPASTSLIITVMMEWGEVSAY